MSLYKKYKTRSVDKLSYNVLKSRFPAVEEDIIISVLETHNKSLEKATVALSEITGIPYDTAIERIRKRKKGNKNVKFDRRGVPWSKMPLPETAPEAPTAPSDTLSDEDFQKWLQKQSDLEEKEKKEKLVRGLIQSVNDASVTDTDEKSWDHWENLAEEADQLNKGDRPSSLILDDFAESENPKETPSAITEMNAVHPIEETNEQKIDATGDSVTANIISEFVETDGNRELVPDLIESNLNSLDCSSCELCIPADSVTSSMFVDKLAETVYIHDDEDQLIVLKLIFKNGSMYRFRVPRKSYTLDKLKRAVNDKLDKGYEDPVAALKIKYFDDEGDWITIASQEEWEEAVRLHTDVLKVHICN